MPWDYNNRKSDFKLLKAILCRMAGRLESAPTAAERDALKIEIERTIAETLAGAGDSFDWNQLATSLVAQFNEERGRKNPLT